MIPLGTEVMINDIIYIAEDVGGSVTENKIDIYVESHQEAINKGIYEVEVYIQN